MSVVVAGAVAEADGDGRAAAGGGRGGEVGRVVVPLQAVCRGIDTVSVRGDTAKCDMYGGVAK